MPLEKLVEKELVACHADVAVKVAADLMRSKDVGAVLVVDKEMKPEGILTDRDIVVRCVCDGRNEGTTKVGEVMTKTVDTARADQGIYDVIRCMKRSEVRRIPVVDRAGRAVALLSFGDLLRLLVLELDDLVSTTTPEEPKIVEQQAA